MDRYTIVFDLDNTIANTHAELVELMKYHYDININKHEYWKHTGKWATVPELDRRVLKVLMSKGFFRHISLLPGVSKYLPKIVTLCENHNILPLIVTAPATDLEGNYFGITDKYNWAREYIPYFPIDNLVIVSDKKSVIDTALLVVEDDLSLLKNIAINRRDNNIPELLCYNQMWNCFEGMEKSKSELNILSISSWSQIYDSIRKKLTLELKEI